jgi:regulator of protease activity HflC (stomatin/prohibitin superfamily)
MVSKYGIEEVYSVKREDLKIEITNEIEFKLAQEGFVLVDFILRNIAFSPEYAASVEQKQIAEQQAQQAEFVVEQKKQEAEQARQSAQGVADASVINAEGAAKAVVIAATAEAEARLIQAEAEAQALKLLGQAIEANPDILTLEYIQKLAPNITVMLVPSDNPYLLPLPDVTQ